MSASPEISVVVATRNRATRLEGLLRSLAEQTVDPERFEVIIVDDGSTDETETLLAEAETRDSPNMTALRRSGNGPAAARNAGWQMARAPLVAFTDDDCEATTDWLERALAAAADHPGEIVQGPTTPIPREVELTGPFTRTKEIVRVNPSFQTCNIVYPRALLERLGGFDEGFSDALGEDTDLGWRARELGAELHWTDDVRVHHAVDYLGPVGLLRTALRGADSVRAFRYQQLREDWLLWGIFRNRRLPWLGLALAGLLFARRSPALAALLCLPYARYVAPICVRQRTSLLMAPYYALWDLLNAYTAIRGSIQNRTLIL